MTQPTDWLTRAGVPPHLRKSLGLSADPVAMHTAAICVLDSGGIIVDPSPAYCRLVGYPRNELVGLHWSAVVPEEKLPQAQRDFARFHAQGASSSVSTVRAKDGSEITGLCIAVRISQERYAAAFLRLTERDERWESWCRAYDHLPCPILLQNPQGVLLFANDAAASLLGQPPTELVGRQFSDFLPQVDGDAFREILHRVDLHGIRGGTWRLRGVDGDEATVQWYATRSPDGDYLVTIPSIVGWPDALFALQAAEVDSAGYDAHTGLAQREELTIDFVHRRVLRAGIPTSLTPTEFAVLQLLVENHDRVVSAHEIMAATWGEHDRDNLGLVRTVISRLRAKIELEHSVPQHIVTVPGQGYRFATKA